MKEYNRADKIMRYLLNPQDESITLTDTEKKRLDQCVEIHGYRLKFMRKGDIAALLYTSRGIQTRQAYNLINETEKIFGTVGKVHKEYERNFLLEASRRNIEIAFAGRNSTQISKALTAHYKFAGLEEFIPDMPDFANLEPHKYIVGLPLNVVDALKIMLQQGFMNLKDFIPPEKFDSSDIPEAKEV